MVPGSMHRSVHNSVHRFDRRRHDGRIQPFHQPAHEFILLDGRHRAILRRVAAQFDTLQDAGVTHAVLSAFGCGAFMNPADKVARAYREELARGGRGLRDVTFAIFDPGYATGNFATFAEVFEDLGAA